MSDTDTEVLPRWEAGQIYVDSSDVYITHLDVHTLIGELEKLNNDK